MKTPGDPSQTGQRIKVGLTGLAAVALLIGMANAVMRTAARPPAISAAGAARPEVVADIADGNVADAGEPLTELGVSPSTTNATAPRPGPP